MHGWADQEQSLFNVDIELPPKSDFPFLSGNLPKPEISGYHDISLSATLKHSAPSEKTLSVVTSFMLFPPPPTRPHPLF